MCLNTKPGWRLAYGLYRRYESRQGQQIFLFSQTFRSHRAYPVSHYMVTGLKRPWRDVDHSPPATVEFKNGCSYTATDLPVSWCNGVNALSGRICKVSSALSTEPSRSEEIRAMWNVPRCLLHSTDARG